ncbi:MAG TPA: hypothetical protein VFV02_01905 [Acidimicrobiales bacterium]|nr:hypothetical protein [Acidimicrobiales bacterium]
MDAPLDPEAATADLISDIVASSLHRCLPDLEVCDLAQGVTSGSPGWRDAWSLGSEPVGPEPLGPIDDITAYTAETLESGLTREEDDELRHLHWLSQIGTLAGHKAERFIELRLKDRRSGIRPPREDEEAYPVGGTKRRWLRLRGR